MYVQLISKCRIHESVNWLDFGSGNGLSPLWHQAITWNNAGSLSIGTLGTNLSETEIKIQNLAFENVCEMAAILSGGDELKHASLLEIYTKAI